jgi:agmatinase
MQVFLETERLALRRFTAADADLLVELDSDPAVMRYLNGGAPTPRDVIEREILPRFLRSYEGGVGYDGFGVWAASAKSSGDFLGWFSFRPMEGGGADEVHLGYRLRQAAWGKGYATEGARALIRKGFTELGVRRVCATTYQDNQASRRVMEKAGLTLVRSYRPTLAEVAATGTFVVSSQELWDGDEVEYGLEKADWERLDPAGHVRLAGTGEPAAPRSGNGERPNALDERDGLGSLDAVLSSERNFLFLDPPYSSFATARVVIVPVPYDMTTCYRPGTREGPQAIIDASRNLETYDPELRRSPYVVGIHTLREVEVVAGNAASMVDRVEQVTDALLGRGKFVVTLGGDHLTTIGVVRAFAKHCPGLSVLQIDAHTDLRDVYEGSAFSSATVMRRVLDAGARTAQVGIRAVSEPEAQLMAERGLPVWLASAIAAQTRAGRRTWIDEVVDALGDDVYVTMDVDGFDPALVPGTGTPEPGGLGWYDVVDLLAAVAARKRIVGGDVVELSPLIEGHVSPVVAAKLVYKLIGLALPEQ